MATLLRSYFEPVPDSRRGFKRFWIPSRGLSAGRWGFRDYTLQDAIGEEIFEFDDMGAQWNGYYDEWIPTNPDLSDEVLNYGIENTVTDEIIERDADYRNLTNRLRNMGIYRGLRNYVQSSFFRT